MAQAQTNITSLLDRPAGINIPRERSCSDDANASPIIRDLQSWDAALLSDVQSFITELAAAGQASIEHDPRWLNVLSQSMGQRPHLLVASDPANPRAIRGVLPLAFVKSWLFGRFLVGLPYLNRAGVAARDESTERQLIDAAVALADDLGARHLELRHANHRAEHDKLTHTREDKPCMLMSLPDSPDALWQQISGKVRNQIRKAEKNNFTVSFGGPELLEAFYDVFAINMRDLGTPVYPKALFHAILAAFSHEAELVVVRIDGQAVAGALLIHDPHTQPHFGRMTQVPSASCLREFNKTNANMWMYHQLLLRAIERGSGGFDFGRSSEDSGTYRFKKQWGAEPHPTAWQYHVRNGDIGDVRPDNPRYKKRIELWQKLPISLSRILGPRIVRGIP